MKLDSRSSLLGFIVAGIICIMFFILQSERFKEKELRIRNDAKLQIAKIKDENIRRHINECDGGNWTGTINRVLDSLHVENLGNDVCLVNVIKRDYRHKYKMRTDWQNLGGSLYIEKTDTIHNNSYYLVGNMSCAGPYKKVYKKNNFIYAVTQSGTTLCFSEDLGISYGRKMGIGIASPDGAIMIFGND